MESSSQSNDQAIVREHDEKCVFFSERRLYQIKNLLLMFCLNLV